MGNKGSTKSEEKNPSEVKARTRSLDDLEERIAPMSNIRSGTLQQKNSYQFEGSCQTLDDQEYGKSATMGNIKSRTPQTNYSSQLQGKTPSVDDLQERLATMDNISNRTLQQENSYQNVSTNRLVVAAIDLGTTYSGLFYAFSHDITKVYQAIAKEPSLVLFTQNKKFFKFGSDAERYYKDNPEDEDLTEFYYFRNFKLFLYNATNLSKDLMIKDITQTKQMLAMEVFSSVITYFVKTFTEILQRQFCDNDSVTLDDVYWVLTVPAIWNLKAKQFMREATEQSGIKPQNLALALEPEVASIQFRSESLMKDNERNVLTSLEEGSKYIILDLGGGTVDITSHEIICQDGLKEVHQASGNNVGGNYVNQEFLKFIESFIGRKRIQDIEKEDPSQLVELLDSFEKKKCHYKISDSSVMIKLPSSFDKMFSEKEVSDTIKSLGYQERVSLIRDKLKLTMDVFEGFFTPTVSGILNNVKPILEKYDDINLIVVVGGLAESSVVIREITDAFQDKKVIVPPEPQFSVLKGAVRFGFRPDIIKARVCRYTYGIAKQRRFKFEKDPVSKMRIVDGRRYCDDVFDKHVEQGEVISTGKFQDEHEYHPVMRAQVSAHLEFYASTKKNPTYVTDDSCQYLGLMEIQLTGRDQHEDGTVLVRMNLSGTELEVEAREKRTGKTTKTTCHFLG